MSFVIHGGMWGDMCLIPIVNGLLAPHLIGDWLLWLTVPTAAMGAVAATVVAHAFWSDTPVVTNYLFPGLTRSPSWWRNVSGAGWLHVLFMALQSTLLLVYVGTPVPCPAVITVSVLLLIHVAMGTALVEWVTEHQIKTSTAPMLLGMVATIVIGVIKIVSH